MTLNDLRQLSADLPGHTPVVFAVADAKDPNTYEPAGLALIDGRLVMSVRRVPDTDDDDGDLIYECNNCESKNLRYDRTVANGVVYTCNDCGEESLFPDEQIDPEDEDE